MRPAAVLLLAMLPVMAASAQNDPAYVDSPESKSTPDPARTDGVSARSGSRGAAGMAYREDDAMNAAEQARQEQESIERMQRITAAQVAAVQMGQQQAMAASAAQQQGYEDPPIGGNRMMRQLDTGRGQDMGYSGNLVRTGHPGGHAPMPPMPAPQSGASARQQMGSALVQDVAGLADAAIQKETGRNRVILPIEARGGR